MRPDDRRYLASHEWCRMEDGLAVIGVTDVGAAMMPSPVFLDLPPAGTTVAIGRPFGECETPNGMFDLISPVDGEIVEVHQDLVEDLGALIAQAVSILDPTKSRVLSIGALADGASTPQESLAKAINTALLSPA